MAEGGETGNVIIDKVAGGGKFWSLGPVLGCGRVGSAKAEARGRGRPKSRLWDERCGSFPGRSRFIPLSEQRCQDDELGFRDGRNGDSRTGTGERSNSGNFDPYFRGIADIFYERVRVTSYVSEAP